MQKKENNVKYWIVRDSYGASRGENGYMRIKIGDKSGAGATAYCDKMDGNYTEIIIEPDSNYGCNIKFHFFQFFIFFIIILLN